MKVEIERDPWYASWFGEEYLALYPDRDDLEAARQAEFVLGCVAPYASRGRGGILDLACGTGRHAVVLSRGASPVIGVDLSVPLLARARARRADPAPAFVRADMRRLPFADGAFGAVVNFFTSFGYFDDPGDDVRVIGEIGRVLAPGGAFLSDVFNAARVLATLVPNEEKTVAGERVSIRRRYDTATRRIEKEITMGHGTGARTFRERVRVYLRAELEALHRVAGFEVRAAFGDFDGTPFDPVRSPRLILLAVTGGDR
ncbi:MAG: methyltransferase domain-containing protein [Thermoanaerobaculia bacterium]|nr:methyltransferase domain-containing protein [Thermoanaerobaculia bacterium]